MKIISGDEFGLIKLISTQQKKVIDQYGSIDSSKSIINIFSKYNINELNLDENSENENNQNINLFVSSLHENYNLDWNNKRIISSYKNEDPEINFISSTIKFEANKNNNAIIINGTSDNKLNIVSFNEDNEFVGSSIYTPLESSNITLKRISNSLFNKDSVYALYKNTPLVLYNIQNQKIEFKGKNLPNDELNLTIPMHDTDVVEVKNNPRLNYVSTAYGEIRLYDKKASPRPSLNKKVTKSKINKIDITDDGNYLFIGDNLGYCAMLDIRKNFSPFRTFKGNSGSIRSLVNIEQNNNIIVAGFDRYIRWYNYKDGDDEKVFVKNKINSAILVGLEKIKNEEFEDEEEGEIDDSELLEEGEEKEEDENNEDESYEQNNSKDIKEESEDEDENELEEKEENEGEDDSKEKNLSRSQSSDIHEEEEENENEENEEDNAKNEDGEEDDEDKEGEDFNAKNGEENEELEDDEKNGDNIEEKEEAEDKKNNNYKSSHQNKEKEEEEEDDEEEEEEEEEINNEDEEEEDEINNEENEDEDDDEEEEINNEENEDEEEEKENKKIFKKRKRVKNDDDDEEEEEEIFNKYNNKKRKFK